jgi:hypothetical protein
MDSKHFEKSIFSSVSCAMYTSKQMNVNKSDSGGDD